MAHTAIGQDDRSANELFDATTMRTVRCLAKRLARKPGFRATALDEADIRQELLLHIWLRRDAYDPARGAWSTFVDRICRNKAARLIEHHSAQRRDYRCVTDIPLA